MDQPSHPKDGGLRSELSESLFFEIFFTNELYSGHAAPVCEKGQVQTKDLQDRFRTSLATVAAVCKAV